MIYICLECEATPLWWRGPLAFFNPRVPVALACHRDCRKSASNCCGLQLGESEESEERSPGNICTDKLRYIHMSPCSSSDARSLLDLGYIILLSCNYEMWRADLERRQHTWRWEKPELHRKPRLLWIKSRAEQREEEKRITRSYGFLLVLQVPRVQKSRPCTEPFPIAHSSCVWQMPTSNWQHPTSLIMTIISAWCSFLDLVLFSAAADLRSGSLVSASCASVWGHFSIPSTWQRREDSADRSKRSLAQFSQNTLECWGLIYCSTSNGNRVGEISFPEKR